MAAQSAPKVVLKSTTKMSLNERFTNMLKNKQPMPVNIRASMQQQQQLASARNRRLAQQMENRPSVQAALKLKQKSLKQRLGKSNIQARLGRPIGPWPGEQSEDEACPLSREACPEEDYVGDVPQEPYLGAGCRSEVKTCSEVDEP